MVGGGRVIEGAAARPARNMGGYRLMDGRTVADMGGGCADGRHVWRDLQAAVCALAWFFSLISHNK